MCIGFIMSINASLIKVLKAGVSNFDMPVFFRSSCNAVAFLCKDF